MTSYKARCIDGGIYERTVTVTVDRRLETMPSAQAGIIYHIDDTDANGRYFRRPGVTLISYETAAATLSYDGILTVDCLCSVTTRRHVSAFLREYCPGITYQDAKAAHAGGYSIDITTGDHIDLKTGEIISKGRRAA